MLLLFIHFLLIIIGIHSSVFLERYQVLMVPTSLMKVFLWNDPDSNLAHQYCQSSVVDHLAIATSLMLVGKEKELNEVLILSLYTAALQLDVERKSSQNFADNALTFVVVRSAHPPLVFSICAR